MPGQSKSEICIFCKQGCVIERNEEITFRQWTDKGYVHCLAIIPTLTCAQCGAKTWDSRANAALDEAVRKEYDKLA